MHYRDICKLFVILKSIKLNPTKVNNDIKQRRGILFLMSSLLTTPEKCEKRASFSIQAAPPLDARPSDTNTFLHFCLF